MSIEVIIEQIEAKVGTLSGAGLDLSEEYEAIRDAFAKAKAPKVSVTTKPATKATGGTNVAKKGK